MQAQRCLDTHNANINPHHWQTRVGKPVWIDFDLATDQQVLCIPWQIAFVLATPICESKHIFQDIEGCGDQVKTMQALTFSELRRLRLDFSHAGRSQELTW